MRDDVTSSWNRIWRSAIGRNDLLKKKKKSKVDVVATRDILEKGKKSREKLSGKTTMKRNSGLYALSSRGSFSGVSVGATRELKPHEQDPSPPKKNLQDMYVSTFSKIIFRHKIYHKATCAMHSNCGNSNRLLYQLTYLAPMFYNFFQLCPKKFSDQCSGAF